MDIRTQSTLLAAIIAVALGLSALLRTRRPRVLTLYSLLALTVGAFYLTRFFGGIVGEAPSAPWLSRVALGASIIVGALVPSTALAFFFEFLRVSTKVEKVGRQLALFSVLLGVGVGVSPLAEFFWARALVSGWILGALALSISLVLSRIRQSESRIERLRLAYLALGFGGSVAFTALEFLPYMGVPFPALGPVVTTLYLFFLSQTLQRLRLMDLHELLGKIASQTVLAIILALVFAVLTSWVEANPSLFLFNTVVAAFVILILLEPLRAKVEEQVVAFFFRERFELLRSLGNLRARTANIIDVTEHAATVLDALIETRRVTHASAYLLADDRPGFRLLAHRGPQPAPFLDRGCARGLLHAAASGQKAVLIEHLDRRIAELRLQGAEGKRARDELKRLGDTKAAMQQLKAGISVPLVGSDHVIGFLNLWDERVPEAYASDEIALILEISEKLATVVENSKLYDRMRERDRLAALGEMSAGLAHEIRNPLGAIKGAAQCLDPSRLPGEDKEFLEVILEEVNRLNGVVTAFLDYARPLKQSFGPTEVNEVVTRTVRLIQNDVPAHIELRVELSETLPKVDGDAEQLKQVLINLVQNATHALDEKAGTIIVRTIRPERFSEFRGSEMVEIRVADTGPGIPSDQQANIFVPFFTTKQKGTGLGLAICQRIVKNHGGNVSVQSRSGEGTTFVVRLPALPAEKPIEAPPIDTTPYPGSISAPPASLPPGEAPRADAKLSRRERKKRKAAAN